MLIKILKRIIFKTQKLKVKKKSAKNDSNLN
jgi:hypothetical protein